MTEGLLANEKDKYTIDSINSIYNVYNIVSFYISRITEHDKSLRYNDFKKRGSTIRILNAILATTIGTNVLDI